MKVYMAPATDTWDELTARPYHDNSDLKKKVAALLNEVRSGGDAALRAQVRRFDGADIESFSVPPGEWAAAAADLDPALKEAIRSAAANIEAFHRAQLRPGEQVETVPGVRCWRKSVGLERVGIYIPGGTAPLFSTVLMLGIPARLAGCREIILCTPPDREGKVHPAILFAARLVGVTGVVRAGGAGAIAALAWGTASIPRVDKIFGPGNQWVTEAKAQAQAAGVAIDMPAGPSEVLVIGDATADPEAVAADLLSQAEHGRDSQVVLVSVDKELIEAVLPALERQLQRLPRSEVARAALGNSRAVYLPDMESAMAFSNRYAPEHLILNCGDAAALAEKVVHAGSVFIGPYAPESAGDYASGTNHTLPTNGYARAYSGVSVDSFVRKITFQELTREGLQSIGGAVVAMAEAEGLQAHAEAVRIRGIDLP